MGKFHYYGIRGFVYPFLKSCLTNRTQYVVRESICSPSCAVTRGVPQGSILGPLLFFIIINDITNSSLFKYNLLKDDRTLTYSFCPRNINSVDEIVNSYLSKVHVWLCTNKIKISVGKTKYIIFSYRKEYCPNIKLGMKAINQKESIKFLALNLDHNLKFDKHINLISGKICKSLGILHRVKTIFPIDIILNLYYSLIHFFCTVFYHGSVLLNIQ